jgi:hypothetical protein
VAPASMTACGDIAPLVAFGMEDRRPLTRRALAIGIPSALGSVNLCFFTYFLKEFV